MYTFEHFNVLYAHSVVWLKKSWYEQVFTGFLLEYYKISKYEHITKRRTIDVIKIKLNIENVKCRRYDGALILSHYPLGIDQSAVRKSIIHGRYSRAYW